MTTMRQYKLIIRGQISKGCPFMGYPVTDDDRKALNCYYETPLFYADSSCEAVEIVDEAYERFCAERPECRFVESAELVQIT